MPDKVYIQVSAAGCYAAFLDASDYTALFEANAVVRTPRIEEARYIIVHACIAGRDDEERSFRLLKHCYRHKAPEAEVIVGGCINASFRRRIQQELPNPIFPYPQTTGLRAYLGFIHDLKEDRLRIKIEQEGLNKTIRRRARIWPVLRMTTGAASRWTPPLGRVMQRFFNTTLAYAPRTYLVRCARGCPNHCSFCQTWATRGQPASRPVERIVEEVCQARRRGFDHFILVADDLASYGLDLGTDFAALLRALADLAEPISLTLNNFNPMHAGPQWDRILGAIRPGLIRSIHFVLQSGSNRILNLMNRPYTREQFLAMERALHEKDPSISLRTDIMVNFPGETEADFQETLSVLQTGMFSAVNIFGYMARPGTPAARLAPGIGRVEGRLRQTRANLCQMHQQALRLWRECVHGAGRESF